MGYLFYEIYGEAVAFKMFLFNCGDWNKCAGGGAMQEQAVVETGSGLFN